jgi:DNA-binding NtrC family response regulator
MSGRKDEVTDKIPEPFQFFSFLEKPFDQKQLIQGIREAMEKSQELLAHLNPESSSTDEMVSDERATVNNAEIQQLKAKVTQLESEIVQLKKQMGKLVAFIKKKLQ